MENVIGFPITDRWISGEEHTYATTITANYGKITAVGTKATTTIANDAAVDHTSDPATVTIATAITSTADIHVFYPDTTEEIIPSNIVITGGNLIITIPRCRMVDYYLRDNTSQGIDYSTVANFQSKVDVVQYTTDTTVQATVVCIPSACSEDCEEETKTACLYIKNAEVGILTLGKVTGSCTCCSGGAHKLRINYRAGLSTLSRKVEMAIVRLAHSRMPTEPCGCDVTQRLWNRDRNEPEMLDRERLNCPFGTSDGAWSAWRLAMSMTTFRMNEFTGGN
jgi:hypothetical protein